MSRETKMALLLFAGEISYLLKTGKDPEAVAKLQALWDRAYKEGQAHRDNSL
jgi:hypothetical protein